MSTHILWKYSETLNCWNEIGVFPKQIIGVGIEKGFWKQGGGLSGNERFRKCGPTTELFFDRGKAYQCSQTCLPGCQCGRFIEIANVLYICARIDQETLSLEPLVTPFIETVLGIERAAMATQQTPSVFETDPFIPVINMIRNSYPHTLSLDQYERCQSERIITDHLRALLFLIADGAPPPGKGGQARIIKILIRKILTHLKQLKISREGVLQNMLETTLIMHHHQYPELHSGYEDLLTYIAEEENKFELTLSRGFRQLERVVQAHGENGFNEELAIDLVKRHGVPLPLLKEKLTQMNIQLNIHNYQKAHIRWQQKIH